jgi:putative ABC transport system permease protein
MDRLRQDLRYAVRSLLRNRGFASVAIATLALGIGANTAIFTIVNGLLLRPLAVADPDRLVVFSRIPDMLPASYPEYLDFRERTTVFDGLTASSVTALALGAAGDNRIIVAELVSGNYFQVMGVQPHRGRLLLPGDDRAPGETAVAVISHAAWGRVFGGSPDVVGQSIALNGHPFTIIGIAPERFIGAYPPASIDVWTPLMMAPQLREGGNDILRARDRGWLLTIGRLRPGSHIGEAEAAIRLLDRQLQEAHPETDQRRAGIDAPWGGGEITLLRLRAFYMPGVREVVGTVTALIMAVAFLVLLIACANVANLLLARGMTRRREIATRLALGASRGQIVRQLLTESLMLALLGAGVGLLVASWTADLLLTIRPPVGGWGDIGFAPDLRVDARVLGVSVLLSILTGLLFGLAPALAASRADVIGALKDERARGGRRRWQPSFRGVLVVGQVAISLVLVIVTGLFVSSVQRTQRIDPGFDPANALVANLNLAQLNYSEERGRHFYDRLREATASLPGATAMSLSSYLPFGAFWMPSEPIAIEGRQRPPDAAPLRVGSVTIDPAHLKTLGISLRRGRNFTAEDTATAPPVVLVSETMARRFWPDEDALGQRLAVIGPLVDSTGSGRTAAPDPPQVYRRVIGVVEDITYQTLSERPRPVMYLPIAQRYAGSMYLVVRTAGDPGRFAAPLREHVRALDEHLPIAGLKTLAEHADVALGLPRLLAGIMGFFGLLAIVLAAVGLYGVIAYSVGQRTREIGIRIALGADRRNILRLVVGDGMALVLVGVAVGLPLAIAVRQILWRLLHTLTLVPSDPLLFVALSLLLAALGLLASYLPSRRATKVDPLVVLRVE